MAQKVLKILLILIGGQIVKKIIFLLSKKVRFIPKKLDQKTSEKQKQKLKTLNSLLVNTGKFVINFTVFLMILSEVGINIIPLITGAGILGLAVGFGAKSLVSDFIAGFFIIMENQFNVGDEIQVGASRGKVTKITLRTITLKDKEGKNYIIPNSSIKHVVKFPREKA